MNREQLITNAKYYTLIGTAKTVACCATVLSWIASLSTSAEVYLIAKSTQYRN